jgi:hypothetical protein
MFFQKNKMKKIILAGINLDKTFHIMKEKLNMMGL